MRGPMSSSKGATAVWMMPTLAVDRPPLLASHWSWIGENKRLRVRVQPFSVDEAGPPPDIKLATVATFLFAAIA